MSEPGVTARVALDALGAGYVEGVFGGERWSVVVTGGPGDRIRKLYAERLAGGDHVSFNLYETSSGAQLKPCEMSETKVLAFLAGFKPQR